VPGYTKSGQELNKDIENTPRKRRLQMDGPPLHATTSNVLGGCGIKEIPFHAFSARYKLEEKLQGLGLA